ncbi:MAG: hypothetical protein U5J64_02130 [Halobacteriales archaeon]|nr:hypothetical protein [Halobacteriales archaeon]
MRDYDYRYETEEGVVRLGAYRNAFNAYVRWRFEDGETNGDGRSGELGGLTEDGMLVLDIQEYVRSNGESETVALPEEAVESIEDDLAEIREEIGDEMTDDEKEAFEDDKRIILRARDILAEEGTPQVDDTEEYVFNRKDGRGNAEEVRVRAEPRDGVAEIAVETRGTEGYSPKYDLSKGVMSLPVDDWGIAREIDVPDGIADALLDDLMKTQEQLNERREAYHEAVELARQEVVDD